MGGYFSYAKNEPVPTEIEEEKEILVIPPKIPVENSPQKKKRKILPVLPCSYAKIKRRKIDDYNTYTN